MTRIEEGLSPENRALMQGQGWNLTGMMPAALGEFERLLNAAREEGLVSPALEGEGLDSAPRSARRLGSTNMRPGEEPESLPGAEGDPDDWDDGSWIHDSDMESR